MDQKTLNNYAAILAAAAAKEAKKVKPLSNATGETPAKQIAAPTEPAKPEVNKDPNNVRTFDNLQDITAAANSGEVISILNLYNIVNDKPTQPAPEPSPRPELSTMTFEDLCNEPAQEEEQPQEPATATPAPAICAPCAMTWIKAGQPATAPEIAPVQHATPAPDQLANFKTMKVGPFTFVQYSEKSFAILAIDETREIKEELYKRGAAYNTRLKCGKGFIFPIKKYLDVKRFIDSKI